MKKYLAIALGAVAALALASCAAKSDTIKIGTIQPISGPVSTYGIQTRDAITLAFDEINASGGVLGKKLALIAEDDEANPEKTTTAFTKLTSKDKVPVIIGALTSKCSLAITALAQGKKIVMISPASTNDTVTDAGDFIFRACYKDSFQGAVVAQFAFETLKAKKAAILFDNTNDYSKGLTTNFTQKFEALGGKIAATESYASGDKDFNAQLTKIKAVKPDVLLIPDYYNTVSLIAKQVRAQGLTIPMVGADGWDEIANNAGDEVLNSFYSNHYSADSNDPDVQKFIAAYKAKYNVVPNALAALGYDAAYMVADAIKAAGSTDSTLIKDALAKTDKKFVTGNIKFDSKHNPVKSAVMLEVVKGADGKLATKFAGTVNP
jgi:branched-chain amino acid transport system substrate-binding protein